MDTFETSTQSFIVKIWVEELSPETGELNWRGQITHVLSGEQHHFQSLEQIRTFMNQYLELDDPPAPTLPSLHGGDLARLEGPTRKE